MPISSAGSQSAVNTLQSESTANGRYDMLETSFHEKFKYEIVILIYHLRESIYMRTQTTKCKRRFCSPSSVTSTSCQSKVAYTRTCSSQTDVTFGRIILLCSNIMNSVVLSVQIIPQLKEQMS